MPAEFDEVFDGVRLQVDLGPLVEAESWRSAEYGMCAALAVVSIGLAFSLRSARREAWLLFVVAVFGFGLGWGRHQVRSSDPRSASLLDLFPALHSRFDACGGWATAAVLGAGAVVLVLLADLPGWKRGWQAHAVRLVVGGALLAAAGYVASVASEVDAFAHELNEATPLPRLELDATQLHVNQSLDVSLRVTRLGWRARPGFFSGYYVERDPGSAADLAALDANEAYRERMVPTAFTIHAPRRPGPFEVLVPLQVGPIRATSTVHARAISDDSDALFPLVAGSAYTWSRSDRTGRGPLREGEPMTLRVDGVSVRDGFVRLSVTMGEQRYELVPWEGTLRLGASADATRFVERVERPDPEQQTLSAPVQALIDLPLEGPLCRIHRHPRKVCRCGADGPLVCVSSNAHSGENLMVLGLGLLTLGASTASGVRMRGATVTEWRLTEVDGRPTETPTIFEP